MSNKLKKHNEKRKKKQSKAKRKIPIMQLEIRGGARINNQGAERKGSKEEGKGKATIPTPGVSGLR
jgi:hypothetical protein